MSWSYSGDPGASDLDMVRFTLGDTDTTDQQLSDEEINAYLVTQGLSVNATVVQLLDILAMKYARRADRTVGDVSISHSQISARYTALRKQLEKQLAAGAGIYSGGQTKSEKQVDRDDVDRVQPSERREQFKNRQPVSGG